MLKQYDVLVIGGGPAGCSAALGLSRKGLKTAIVEKHHFPRVKACGGLVTNKSVKLLEEMNINIPKKIVEDNISSISINTDKQSHNYTSSRELGVTVKREKFDNYLLNTCRQNEIDIYEGVYPLEIIQQQGMLKVICNTAAFECKRLAAADGVYGKTSSLLKMQNPISQKLCGITMAGIGITNTPKQQGRVSFYNTCYPGGWGWMFSLKEEVNIGIGLPITSRKNIKDYYSNLIKTLEVTNIKTKSSIIPAGGIRKKLSSNTAVLVGDAGYFVDPFSGEGIYYAIKTGMIGANHIAKSLTQQKYSLEKGYTKECADTFYKSFRQSMMLTLLSGYKKYPCIVSNNINEFPKFMASLMTGDIDYKEILKEIRSNRFKYIFHNWIK